MFRFFGPRPNLNIDFKFRNGKQLTSLNGTNAVYMEEMYNSWKKDPNSVHKSWDVIFRQEQNSGSFQNIYIQPPPPSMFTSFQPLNRTTSNSSVEENLGVLALIDAYKTFGHFAANLDPLGFQTPHLSSKSPKELNLSYFKLSEKCLDNVYTIPASIFNNKVDMQITLRDLIEQLKKTYCGNIGIEYQHITDSTERTWLQERFEDQNYRKLNNREKTIAFLRLTRATLFEEFLAKKFPGEKRFGAEGGESFVPCLKTIIDESSRTGIDSFVIGMAHRGRLNLLANVCRKPLDELFSRFDSNLESLDEGSGDVKYHLGMSQKWHNNASGKVINVAVVANPSHLECVNPVVQGKVCAEQFYNNDVNGNKIMSLLVHGDASFAGQGIVYESLNLSKLKNYSNFGTIHLVINNQIGFTTNFQQSRSSNYCTDIAKFIEAPILHVNADHVDDVVLAAKLASEYRQTFKKDFVIDLICYRKNGHNEADNANFSQPLMYKKIREQKPTLQIYTEKLIMENVLDQSQINEYRQAYMDILEKGMNSANQMMQISNKNWVDSPFLELEKTQDRVILNSTGIKKDLLINLLNTVNNIPEDFVLVQGMDRIMKQREKMVHDEKIDWALGEIAAFSSLLIDGVHVRLSGQDVERGTFSHRHHVLHHSQKESTTYVPMNNLKVNQAPYTVTNSHLSEYGVLGFELGYSLASSNSLVIWEAQFGDFANTAQCIIDQFICSGYTKWLRQTGITLLLPHGFDGMGPEHSSARLERFLQLVAEDADSIPDYPVGEYAARQLFDCNMIVANCTTPANIFHILRRQVAGNFRRPLVVMSPKNLLRLEAAKSSLSEFEEGTSFRSVIPDSDVYQEQVKKLIFCSGKVYYDLANHRKTKNVAIVRVEQLSPFPFDLIGNELKRYANAEIAWVQEEPKNQGAWSYIATRFQALLKGEKKISYIGRKSSATTATGNKKTHVFEQQELINKALEV